MPGLVELVVPGVIKHLEIVEFVLAVVEAVQAGIAVSNFAFRSNSDGGHLPISSGRPRTKIAYSRPRIRQY
jgi:hypothetical protein